MNRSEFAEVQVEYTKKMHVVYCHQHESCL